MNEKYHSLLANDTWDLVPLPKGRKIVRCKWVYRTKFGPDRKVGKHKARLVAKCFSQVECINYTETFSHVTKMNSIRLVLSLVASFKWEVHQMDVKFAFLHGDLHEEIYMEQPPGFRQIESGLVCQLKKSLYGLKQAPRAWYAKIDSFLLDIGFSRRHSDNTVYTKKVVLQSKEGISLSQSKYACDILCHFHMEDYKPALSPFQFGAKLSVTCTSPEVDATLYCQLVGKLLYLTHSHPDLSFVVGRIAWFMQNPHESHWKATKRIIRYVQGTV
eukprot:PITA_18930